MRHTRLPAWLGRMAYERAMDAVRTYTALGWPVCIGAYLVDDACSCGCSGCTSPGAHPTSAATTRDSEIAALLRRAPEANIMVATGRGADAVEVSVPRGRVALAQAAALGPVASAFGVYVLFAASGQPVLAPGLRWYGKGGHVLVPPSHLPAGHAMRWIYGPERPLPAMTTLATALFER